MAARSCAGNRRRVLQGLGAILNDPRNDPRRSSTEPENSHDPIPLPARVCRCTGEARDAAHGLDPAGVRTRGAGQHDRDVARVDRLVGRGPGIARAGGAESVDPGGRDAGGSGDPESRGGGGPGGAEDRWRWIQEVAVSTIYYALCLQCLEAVPVFTVAAGTLVMGIAPNDRRGQDAAAGFLIAHSGPRHRLPELVSVAERTLRVGIEVGDTMIL